MILNLRELNQDQQSAVFELLMASQKYQRFELDQSEQTESDLRQNMERLFKDLLQQDRFETLVWVEGEPIGYIRAEQTKKGALIDDLYVKPASRTHGIGQKLLEAVLDWAKKCGNSRVALGVHRQNQVAQKLYQSMGFTEFPSEYLDYEKVL